LSRQTTDVDTAFWSLSLRVGLFKNPLGTHRHPARTCRDLKLCRPEAESGQYWIDPNGGITEDSILVYCDFALNASCITPNQFMKWYSGRDGYKWFAQDLHGSQQFHYTSDPSQLLFLRLLSDRASQKITYHCRNSVAWYDSRSRDFDKSIKLKSGNGIELYAASSNKYKPTIIKDDCGVKDGKWRKTVLEVNTESTHRLPIVDIAVFDIGDRDEEFGLQIGSVCFS
ncbi:predicted protein, partial [Nematostella vectensis]